MVATLKFDTERMAYLAPRGFALATDIAEWLVREGVPFRVAHELSGACVQLAESRDVELWDLSDEDFSGISPHLTPAVREVLTTLGSIDSRNAKGGTARSAVEQQIANAKAEKVAHACVSSQGRTRRSSGLSSPATEASGRLIRNCVSGASDRSAIGAPSVFRDCVECCSGPTASCRQLFFLV